MNYIQSSILDDGAYKAKFLASIDTTQKETTQKENTSEGTTTTGNEIQVVTEGGELGITDGKGFKSLNHLKKKEKSKQH